MFFLNFAWEYEIKLSLVYRARDKSGDSETSRIADW